MEQAATKAQIKRRYTHLTWVVSGSLFAAGLGLSLSLMFLGVVVKGICQSNCLAILSVPLLFPGCYRQTDVQDIQVGCRRLRIF